jgi:acetoin utilization deacetylase AcuC-like enzyme
VAIVDYDVHHGNGTQHIFEADPNVLYVSTHQFPYYPGTGAADEVGVGAGRGFTVNLPLEVGAVDEDYQRVFAAVVVPVLKQFAPDLLMVSAGFDAHERDPLGGMRLSTDAFAAMTLALRIVSEQCCGGRIAVITEGGYDLHALAASLDAVAGVLNGPMSAVRWAASGIDSDRGRSAIDATTRALAPFWRF